MVLSLLFLTTSFLALLETPFRGTHTIICRTLNLSRRKNMKSLRFLGNEVVLGTLIAVLSIFTAFASWQGSIADSKQSEHELLAMQHLNDGNAEYLSANQFIVYDYTMYDGWYTADTADKEEYYTASYSEELQDAVAADPENPFSEEYYDAMYADSYGYWEESDA